MKTSLPIKKTLLQYSLLLAMMIFTRALFRNFDSIQGNGLWVLLTIVPLDAFLAIIIPRFVTNKENTQNKESLSLFDVFSIHKKQFISQYILLNTLCFSIATQTSDEPTTISNIIITLLIVNIVFILSIYFERKKIRSNSH